jgi:hypothetical protein
MRNAHVRGRLVCHECWRISTINNKNDLWKEHTCHKKARPYTLVWRVETPETVRAAFLRMEKRLTKKGVVGREIDIGRCIPDEDLLKREPCHAEYPYPVFGDPREWTTKWAPNPDGVSDRVLVEATEPADSTRL